MFDFLSSLSPIQLAIGVAAILAVVSGIIYVCTKKPAEEAAAADSVPDSSPAIENRQEIIAAVSAVIAEEMGTEVSALRVLSFKKI